MVSKKMPYTTQETYVFLDQKRKQLTALRKEIIKLGLNPMEHAVFLTPEQQEKWLMEQIENQAIRKR